MLFCTEQFDAHAGFQHDITCFCSLPTTNMLTRELYFTVVWASGSRQRLTIISPGTLTAYLILHCFTPQGTRRNGLQ